MARDGAAGDLMAALGRLSKKLDDYNKGTEKEVKRQYILNKSENKRIDKYNLDQIRLTDKKNTLIKKENDGIVRFNAEIDKATKLQKSLSQAGTLETIAKNLSRVLKEKMGGEATGGIGASLARAKSLTRESKESDNKAKKYDVRIADLITKQSNLHLTSSFKNFTANFNKIQSQIGQLQSKQAAAYQQSGLARNQANRYLGLGKRMALGRRSKLGNIASKKFPKATAIASSKANIVMPAISTFANAIMKFAPVFSVVTETVKLFQNAISESSNIISKYSQYSIGGMQAAMTIQIGEIKRNVYSSKMLSSSMREFAKANVAMNNSWKNVNVVADKVTLTLGRLGSKAGSFLGNLLDPIANGLDQFIGMIAKTFGVEWETIEEKLAKMAAVRNANFAAMVPNFRPGNDIRDPRLAADAQNNQFGDNFRRRLLEGRRPGNRLRRDIPVPNDPNVPIPNPPIPGQPQPQLLPAPRGMRGPQARVNPKPVPQPPVANPPPDPAEKARRDALQKSMDAVDAILGGIKGAMNGNRLRDPVNGGPQTIIEPGEGYNRNLRPMPAGLFV